jgi:hypothetical protein
MGAYCICTDRCFRCSNRFAGHSVRVYRKKKKSKIYIVPMFVDRRALSIYIYIYIMQYILFGRPTDSVYHFDSALIRTRLWWLTWCDAMGERCVFLLVFRCFFCIHSTMTAGAFRYTAHHVVHEISRFLLLL